MPWRLMGGGCFVFRMSNDAGKKSMMFFFLTFGSMWIYDGSWCFFHFMRGFFVVFLGVERIWERTFLLFGGGGRHFFLNCQVRVVTCE